MRLKIEETKCIFDPTIVARKVVLVDDESHVVVEIEEVKLLFDNTESNNTLDFLTLDEGE